ncbi:DUF6152 family protein [Lacibacterium aquatile]|uniref:DUF6152 family protein n=1 Tax=Lacibacterium aquatile TaxID=1168082 RepID=A0ABW5DUP5_9PROT
MLRPVAILTLIAAPVLAHHGWGSYDSATVLTLEAPILSSSYQSPHGELELDHQGKRWQVILAPPFRMQNRGLPAEDIAPGTLVKIEGYPSRVHDGELRAERISVKGRTVELR